MSQETVLFPLYVDQKDRFECILQQWRTLPDVPETLMRFAVKLSDWAVWSQIAGESFNDTMNRLQGYTVDPMGKRFMVLKKKGQDGVSRNPHDLNDRMVLRHGKFLEHLKREGMNLGGFDLIELAEMIGVHWPTPYEYKYEILYGDVKNNKFPIYDAYNTSGIESCMEGQPYVKWYDQNPQSVGLLVQYDPTGSIVGRALVWRGKYVDRMYPGDGSAEFRAFQAYVNAHDTLLPKNSWRSDTLDFEMCISDYGYPYMDTFDRAYPDWTKRVITVSNYQHGSGYYDDCVMIWSQSGDGPVDPTTTRCHCCNRVIKDEDVQLTEHDYPVCPSCAFDRYARVAWSDTFPSRVGKLVHRSEGQMYFGQFYLYSDIVTAVVDSEGVIGSIPRKFADWKEEGVAAQYGIRVNYILETVGV